MEIARRPSHNSTIPADVSPHDISIYTINSNSNSESKESNLSIEDDSIDRFRNFLIDKFKVQRDNSSQLQTQEGRQKLIDASWMQTQDFSQFVSNYFFIVDLLAVFMLQLLKMQSDDQYQPSFVGKTLLLAIILRVRNYAQQKDYEDICSTLKENSCTLVSAVLVSVTLLLMMPIYNLESLFQSVSLVYIIKIYQMHQQNIVKQTQKVTLASFIVTLIQLIYQQSQSVERLTIFELMRGLFSIQKISQRSLTPLVINFCVIQGIIVEFSNSFQDKNRQQSQNQQFEQTDGNQLNNDLFNQQSQNKLFIQKIEQAIVEFKLNQKAKNNCSVRGQNQTGHLQNLDNDGLLHEENEDKVHSILQNVNRPLEQNGMQRNLSNTSGLSDKFFRYPQQEQGYSTPLFGKALNGFGVATETQNKIRGSSMGQANNYVECNNYLFNMLNKQVLIFKIIKNSKQNNELYQPNSDVEPTLINSLNDSFHKLNEAMHTFQKNKNKLFFRQNNKPSQSQNKIGCIQHSASFFEELPFYYQIQHLHKRKFAPQINQINNNQNEADVSQTSINEQLMIHSSMQKLVLQQLADKNSNSQLNSLDLQSDNDINFITNIDSHGDKPIQRQQQANELASLRQLQQDNQNLHPVATNHQQEEENQDLKLISQLFKQRRNLTRFKSTDILNQKNNNDLVNQLKINSLNKQLQGVDQFIKLTDIQKEMMELQIFQPYFLNHQTKLEYNGKTISLSIAEILQSYAKKAKVKSTCRLYFKVNQNDCLIIRLMNLQCNSIDKPANTQTKFASKQHINVPQSEFDCSCNQSINISDFQVEQNQINSSPPADDFPILKLDLKKNKQLLHKSHNCDKNFQINKSIESSQSKSSIYSMVSQSEAEGAISTRSVDEQLKYYEFEFYFLDQFQGSINQNQLEQRNVSDCYMLSIRDVTNLIKSQKQLSDQVYQQAIEGNFSHCQMTPLNFLMQSPELIKSKVHQLFTQNQQIIFDLFEYLSKKSQFNEVLEQYQNKFQQIMSSNKKITNGILNISNNSEQLSYQLWMLNQGQLKRIQIHQNKFKSNESVLNELVAHFHKLFNIFSKDILLKNLNVYIMLKKIPQQPLKADWDNINLILFNIFHNAIKFNIYGGDICVVIQVKKWRKNMNSRFPSHQNSQIYSNLSKNQDLKYKFNRIVLDIQIIDTGEGISQERQQMLFTPFMELMHCYGKMKSPKNDNIGLGLAASKQIAKGLKGDLIIQQSQQGLTIFRLKVPVKPQHHNILQSVGQIIESQSQNDQQIIQNINLSKKLENSNKSHRLGTSLIDGGSGNGSSQSNLSFSFPTAMSRIIQLFGNRKSDFNKLLRRYLNKKFSIFSSLNVEMRLQNNLMNDGNKLMSNQLVSFDLKQILGPDDSISRSIPARKSNIEFLSKTYQQSQDSSNSLQSQQIDVNSVKSEIINQDSREKLQKQFPRQQGLIKRKNTIQDLIEPLKDFQHNKKLVSFIENKNSQNNSQSAKYQIQEVQRCKNYQISNKNSLDSEDWPINRSIQHQNNQFNFGIIKQYQSQKQPRFSIHQDKLQSQSEEESAKFQQINQPNSNSQQMSNNQAQKSLEALRQQLPALKNKRARGDRNSFENRRQNALKMVARGAQEGLVERQRVIQMLVGRQIKEKEGQVREEEGQEVQRGAEESVVVQEVQDQSLVKRNKPLKRKIKSFSLDYKIEKRDFRRDEQANIREEIDQINDQVQNISLQNHINEEQNAEIVQEVVKNIMVLDIDVDKYDGDSDDSGVPQFPQNSFNINSKAIINNHLKVHIKNQNNNFDNQYQLQQFNGALQQQKSDNKQNIIKKSYNNFQRLQKPQIQISKEPCGSLNEPNSAQIRANSSESDRRNNIRSSQQNGFFISTRQKNLVKHIKHDRFEEEKQPAGDSIQDSSLGMSKWSRMSKNSSQRQDQIIQSQQKQSNLHRSESFPPMGSIQSPAQSPNNIKSLQHHQDLSQIDENEELQPESSRHDGSVQNSANRLVELQRWSQIEEVDEIDEREEGRARGSVSNQIIERISANNLDQSDIDQIINLQMSQKEQQKSLKKVNKNLKQSKQKDCKNHISDQYLLQHVDKSMFLNKQKQQPNKKPKSSLLLNKKNPKSILSLEDSSNSSNINQQFIDNVQISNYLADPRGQQSEPAASPCDCLPKILIVDDNAFNLDIQKHLIQSYLEQHMDRVSFPSGAPPPPASQLLHLATDGHIAVHLVRQALEGSQTCNRCNNSVFRLIVMDLQMQQMDGDVAASQIGKLIREENRKRQRESNQGSDPFDPQTQQQVQIPPNELEQNIVCNIVACTANTTQYWSQKVRDSGMVHMTNKPLQPDDVAFILSKWFFDQ